MKPCESLNVFADQCLTTDVTEHMRRVVDGGFTHLDMNFLDWSRDAASPFRQAGWQDWVRRIADNAGRMGARFTQSHAHVYNFYRDPADGMNEEQMRRSVIGSGMLGVKWVVMHPSQRPDYQEEGSHEKMLAANAAYFRKQAELAAENGTGIALENMRDQAYGLTTADELLELIGRVDMPNVGACWDTGHANLTGADQSASIIRLGGRLHALHVADNYGMNDDHTMPFIGNINWKAVTDALKEIGYDGDFTFESQNLIRSVPEACKNDALKLMYRVGLVLSGNAD